MFSELYDFYNGKEDKSLLNEQMKARGTPSGRTPFHYVAQYGRETLITKVLELPSTWVGPDDLPSPEYLKILCVTEEGSTVTTISLLKDRPELTQFILKLEPPPKPTIVVPKKSLKESIKEKLEHRQNKLESIYNHADNLYKTRGGRRNWLAQGASEKQRNKMNNLLASIESSTKADAILLHSVREELQKASDSAESTARKWDSYAHKVENNYAEDVCYQASEVWKLAKNDLAHF